MNPISSLKLLNSKYLLSITIILGLFVLLSYYVLLPRALPSQTVDPLWFGIDGRLRSFYYASILCSGVVFLCGLYWVYRNIDGRNVRRYIAGYALLLLSALLWTVSVWWWGQTTSFYSVKNKYRTTPTSQNILTLKNSLF